MSAVRRIPPSGGHHSQVRFEQRDARGLVAFPVKFVHIGLGKCASTYLQQVWGADKTYAPIEATPLVQTTRERAARSCFDIVDITPPDVQTDKVPILSSEGLSWGWINGDGDAQSVRNLRKIVADSLLVSRAAGQVLVVVRNPVEWLRALHEQSIKEGGYDPYKTYIGDNKELALAILDLAHLVELHSELSQRVVILSADELRRAPETFWDKYAAALDAPKPSSAALASVEKREFSGNVSLKERVPYLANLNRYGAKLGACFAALSNYQDVFQAESEALKPLAGQHLVRMHRRIAEFAEFPALQALAGEVEDAAGFQDVFVDPEMAERIEKTFIGVLAEQETIDPALIDEYRRSLDEKCRGDETVQPVRQAS